MKAVVVPPGEGRFIAVGSSGAGVMVKASEAETGGLCTVWEGRVPPGTVGAGPHYHHERDEFFYVLEGELVLRIGEERYTARAGTFAFVPRETIHGFHNASNDSATLLVMHHPAGFERYLEEMQQLAARHGGRGERATLAARFDMIPVPAVAGEPGVSQMTDRVGAMPVSCLTASANGRRPRTRHSQ
jgi:mannose-6-phosphate isomerase-like protein (cupin superfamily)